MHNKGSSSGFSVEKIGKIAGCILLYYPFSIGLTFYQQWFMRVFHFPLFVVLCHYILKFLFAALFRKCYTLCTQKQRVMLNWRDYFFKVAATGIAASIDIGLSNWSFQYVTISLYTMAKSSCIVFILLFALLLSLERFQWSLVGVVVLIAFGLVLFTYKSTHFSWFGFLLVESAAFSAGLRWALCQLLLQKEEIGLHNPVDLIFHVQPWMILVILPLVFIFEADKLLELEISNSTYYVHYILIGGTLGLFMELAEFLLIYHTSSLTLNVCGVAKELITLTLAHFFKGDLLSRVNLVGLLLCLCGIVLHVVVKNRKNKNGGGEHGKMKKNDLKSDKHSVELSQQLLSGDNDELSASDNEDRQVHSS